MKADYWMVPVAQMSETWPLTLNAGHHNNASLCSLGSGIWGVAYECGAFFRMAGLAKVTGIKGCQAVEEFQEDGTRPACFCNRTWRIWRVSSQHISASEAFEKGHWRIVPTLVYNIIVYYIFIDKLSSVVWCSYDSCKPVCNENSPSNVHPDPRRKWD